MLPQRICMISDGSMATVLALLLESRGLDVTIWGRTPQQMAEMDRTRENRRHLPGVTLPDRIRVTGDDKAAFKDVELIVSTTPTQFIRPIWKRLAPHVPADVPICTVAKGIETETLLRPTQILADVLRSKGDRPLGSLSGPSVAAELARSLPATVCAASDDEAFAHTMQHTFTTNWFRVYTNTDLLGVELAGATKNVIALAAGILDGLEVGINAKSALLTRGLTEITRLGSAMGAKTDTFFGLTGIGDLATTCFSPTGRNRTCGELLGKGASLDEALAEIPGVVEGVPTTRSVLKLAQRHGVEMPITQCVNDVLFAGLNPIEGIGRLMTRDLKAE